MNELTKRSGQLEQAMFEMRRVVVGQDRVLERLMVALLAGGHTLLEGVPGLGKTLTLSTMARVLGGSFSRIQFTPDLLPSDITGTRIYLASQERFDVEPGPVLANFVLADEINRAPAKVQSAMLEVMAEHQVTIGDRTFAAPDPFLVMATQNPIESEGVYPLPEAQRDRFMMRVPVGYPTMSEEREIVRRMDVVAAEADPILDPADVVAMQRAVRAIFVDQKVVDYALRIVTATRRPRDVGMDHLEGLIEYGASPRASIALTRGAQAMALLKGRGYALPQDVYEIAYDVLNHRVVLSYEALADGLTVDDLLVELLSKLPAPRITVSEAHGDWADPVPTRASAGHAPLLPHESPLPDMPWAPPAEETPVPYLPPEPATYGAPVPAEPAVVEPPAVEPPLPSAAAEPPHAAPPVPEATYPSPVVPAYQVPSYEVPAFDPAPPPAPVAAPTEASGAVPTEAPAFAPTPAAEALPVAPPVPAPAAEAASEALPVAPPVPAPAAEAASEAAAPAPAESTVPVAPQEPDPAP